MNSKIAEQQYQLSKWYEIVKECECSKRKMEWLKEHNISKDQYYYWKRKLKDACLDSMQPAFVELPVVTQPASVEVIKEEATAISTKVEIAATLTIGNVSVDITNSASSEFIRSIIEAIAYAK